MCLSIRQGIFDILNAASETKFDRRRCDEMRPSILFLGSAEANGSTTEWVGSMADLEAYGYGGGVNAAHYRRIVWA